MNPWLFAIASGLGALGAWWLYLASPQQQWRARGPWPSRHRLWPGGTALLISMATFLANLGTAAALSAWLVVVMLVWSLAPFAGAWRARRRRVAP